MNRLDWEVRPNELTTFNDHPPSSPPPPGRTSPDLAPVSARFLILTLGLLKPSRRRVRSFVVTHRLPASPPARERVRPGRPLSTRAHSSVHRPQVDDRTPRVRVHAQDDGCTVFASSCASPHRDGGVGSGTACSGGRGSFLPVRFVVHAAALDTALTLRELSTRTRQ